MSWQPKSHCVILPNNFIHTHIFPQHEVVGSLHITYRIDYPNHLHTKILSPFSINTSQYKLTHKIWYAIVIGENQKLRTLNWLSSFPLNYSELIFAPIICYLSIGSIYFTILYSIKLYTPCTEVDSIYNLKISILASQNVSMTLFVRLSGVKNEIHFRYIYIFSRCN